MVEHNLFYNLQRPFAFQKANGAANTTVAGMVFSNNLSIWNADSDFFPDGQPGFAFNKNDDVHTTNDGTLIWEHNTFVADTTIVPNFGNTNGLVKQSLIDVSKIVRNEHIFRGNIGYARWARNGATYPVDGLTPSTPDNGGTLSYHNQWVSSGGYSGFYSFGQNDFTSAGTMGAVFNFTTNQVIGASATAAIDGGSVGHRWTLTPTRAQCDQIFSARQLTWASTYPAAAMPSYVGFTPGANDYVLNNEDKR